ncbi:hypothetical protein AAZV13_11G127300 [Glycine max]
MFVIVLLFLCTRFSWLTKDLLRIYVCVDKLLRACLILRWEI